MSETMHDMLTGYFKPDELERIESARIFIAGCGGLGSNIAHMLTRIGFCRFTLLDFDVVEYKNLNRQFFFPDQIGMKKAEALAQNIMRLNDALELTLIKGKLESSGDVATLTKDCDILVEAFDKPESKAIFVTGALPTGKPVISASGLAGYGNTDSIIVQHPKHNLYLVGDGMTDISVAPPLAPRVNVAAAKQADLVLELTLGLHK